MSKEVNAGSAKGAVIVVAATAMAVLLVKPLVDNIFARVFGQTPAQVLSFKKA